MDIEHFIQTESDYFAPMLRRQLSTSANKTSRWREETVRQRHERISLEVYDLLNGTVTYGPFKGLKLTRFPYWGSFDLGSQCLGLYELEVLEILRKLSPVSDRLFIDIGAADGYYALGMLYANKCAKAICFEKSERGRETIQQNAKLNNLESGLFVLGEATSESILGLSPTDLVGAVVIIDIEGYEFELLTETVLRQLKNCTLIIEIHNWVENFEEKYPAFLRVASLFFDIEIIERFGRDTSNMPELRDFTDDNRLLCVSERRPCLQRFLKLTGRVT
jgi:hypothetical protein